MYTVNVELNNGKEFEYSFYNLEDALWMVDEQVSSGTFKRVVVLDGRNCVSSTVR